MIRLRDDRLDVAVAPEHGMTVVSIVDRDSGADLLWQHPRNRVRALPDHLGAPGPASRAVFEDTVFVGGWFAMFPTVGDPGSRDDVWLHGEAPRRRWSLTASGQGSVTARVELRTVPLSVGRTVTLEGASVRIRTLARNDGDEVVAVTAGEHPCFDQGALGISAVTLGQETVPVPPDQAIEHRMYEADGRASFEARAIGKTVTLEWDSAVLPAVLTWRRGSEVLAIEPRSTSARSADAVPDDQWWRIRPGGEVGWAMQLSLS
ncbi:hypothetical protein [Cryocola sp. 340MFSha3.1]|uniref:hypothetical protein n=1 Tax=Cryocola sp. 340MFSha3.1 TaxID=1169145 RepID=UPI000375D814|nr:hypothetical protein [Cryocola sp. 340MFSha3.1]